MSIVFRSFRNLRRIICVSACVFCVFIGSALSSNNLPSGYTELEYIESTGKQWIDSDTIADYDTSITVKAVIPNVAHASQLFGNNVDANQKGFTCNVGNSSTNISRFDSTLYTGNLYIDSTNAHTYTVNVNGIQIDKQTIINWSTTPTQFSQDSSFYILASRKSEGATYIMPNGTKLYSAQVYNKENLIRNFVPAKKDSNITIGMYDTVSDTFFTNSGTGTFIAGPAVVIQVATTKYVETAFADSVSELNTAIGTVKTVVDNTIIQADRIGKLHTGKQTRPDEQCPANAQCLLITEPDGSLHWYPICNGDGSIFNADAFLTAFTNAGKPDAKSTQDPNNKYTYYNGFFKGASAWRQQYVDGSTITYDRPLAHATRCTNPNYTTEIVNASPCYTEVGMYKTLNDGEWAVVYEGDEKATNASTPADPGVIYGISKCVSTNLTGSVSYATKATVAQLADPLFSGIPTNQTDGANYKQCWCKMTAIGLPGDGTTTDEKAANGGIVNVSGTAWIFYHTENSVASCAYDCAYACAGDVRYNASFRSAILSTNN